AASTGATIAFTGTPAPGETWTLMLDQQTFTTTASVGDTLGAIVQRLAALLPGTYTRSVAGTILSVARAANGSKVNASATGSPPDVGTISWSTSYNEASVTFAGQPVAGETWTLNVDGGVHSVVSSAGQTLGSIVQAIATQIPGDYQVSVGLDSLFIVHGFGL